MPDTPDLFLNNQKWADQIKAEDPDFFLTLSQQQNPEYLWIGCADSRVPANEIVGLLPGELFVHRNVANIVYQTDLNCLSVIQYAVEYLKVKHIFITGHYGCGGVKAALEDQKLGLIDNWLRSIRRTYLQNLEKFEGLENEEERLNLLCELNVIKQVANTADTTIVQDAWARGQELSIHGFIYSIKDGILKNLNVTLTGNEES